jgi:O-antigen/teichoic acid export membrane protein
MQPIGWKNSWMVCCEKRTGKPRPRFLELRHVLKIKEMSDKIAAGNRAESVLPASERYRATGEATGNEPPPADLKGRTVRGGAITFVAQVIKVAINMGSTVALARLLTPADYGLIAMVTGVTGFVEMFKDAGLSTATVQRERITNEQISTLFWLNVAMSFCLMLMVVALAPFLGVFYHEPRLVWVTIALAGTFLFSGLTVQHQALLRRNMKFKQLAVIDVVSLGVGLVSAVVMALLGYRYWALVGMAVASSFVNAVAVWIAVPWRPGPPRRGCDVRPMIGFGGGIIGTRFLYAFVRNTPNVLLGWAFGAAQVGLYQRAYTLLMFAVDQIQTPVTAVAIAPMSRLQADWPRLRRYFLAGYSVVISCILPIVVTCAVYAEEIIAVLLGHQWLPAVGVFRWLSLAGVFVGLLNPQGMLLLAMGLPAKCVIFGLIDAVCVVVGYVVGLSYGAEGVAAGFFVAKALTCVPMTYGVFKHTPVTLRDAWETARAPLIAIGLAAVAGLAAKMLLAGSIAPWLVAGIGCSLMSLVYALILLFVLGQWHFYYDIVMHLMPQRKPSVQPKDDVSPEESVAINEIC